MHPAAGRSWRTRTSPVRGAGSGTAHGTDRGARGQCRTGRDRATPCSEPARYRRSSPRSPDRSPDEPASARRPARPARRTSSTSTRWSAPTTRGGPDPAVPAQRVAFGTSGHRGSALRTAFNEAHILATTEAIWRYRAGAGLYRAAVHRPRHARPLRARVADRASRCWSRTGSTSAVDAEDGYTPTPAVSHAILVANRGRTDGLADGIVVTPSHNPPDDGGFKYNPPNGGPADTDVTRWIQDEANRHPRGVGRRRARRRPRASRSSARSAPPGGTTTGRPTWRTSAASSTSRRCGRRGCGSASTRWAARRWPTGA